MAQLCGATPIRAYTPRRISFNDVRIINIEIQSTELLTTVCTNNRVRHRPHKLSINFNHQSPAYLDEDYPVEIEITNTDTRELEAVLSFLLQPTETDDASKRSWLGHAWKLTAGQS